MRRPALLAGLALVMGCESSTAGREPPPSRFDRLAVGTFATCARTPEARWFCWGAANPAIPSSALPRALALPVPLAELALGDRHACGLTAGGQAYCWGENDEGQLGTGTLGGAVQTPTAVAGGERFTQIVADREATCALSTTGDVWCWGRTGALAPAGAPPGGTNPPRPTSAHPLRVLAGSPVREILLGADFACGRESSGAVRCWGEAAEQRLGYPRPCETAPKDPCLVDARPVPGIPPVAGMAGSLSTCAWTASGALHCWGSVFGAPAPRGEGLVFVSSAARGATHCGVADDGRGYCWGALPDDSNGPSQLSLEPVEVPGGVTLFREIAPGAEHACGLSPEGAAYCWGWASAERPLLGVRRQGGSSIPLRVGE